MSGTGVGSYHGVNLAIHILAALTLFGILRRTLGLSRVSFGEQIAFSAALIWAVHPLLTEAVTYTIQRAESLMGFFYLQTLYCLMRGAQADAPRRRFWYAASIGACLLGSGTKEAIVSAPIVALLFDRTFLAGGFKRAWDLRKGVYCGLLVSWVTLAGLISLGHGRSGTVGFESGPTVFSYALTQFPAIVHYILLCLWPGTLIFDYGTGLEAHSLRVVPYALVIVLLGAGTAWALVRRPVLGFLGAAFFLMLAPSSSIVPVATETMAEQRMYLASIAVILPIVLLLYRVLQRAALPVCVILASLLLVATFRRNRDYQSAQRLWADTVRKLPENERAHYNLGCVLDTEPGERDEAIRQFEEAVTLRPNYFKAREFLGNVLLEQGHPAEAALQLRESVQLNPDDAQAHNNLGDALRQSSDDSGAMDQFEAALRLRPNFPEAHNNMGCVLERIPGREQDAVAQFDEAIRDKPAFYQAHFNLAATLLALGQIDEAILHYQEAASLKPDDPTLHFYLAGALLRAPGRTAEAVDQLREVLRLKPDFERARTVLAKLGESP
jgi:tetratricopeptide (TPR) repeat protein